MSSIAKIPSGQWRARYRDAAGKEHARHFDRKVDAQRWLDSVTAAVVTGTYCDPDAGRATVGSLADAWLAGSVGWSASTRARNESIVERHVRPAWGTTPVSKVSFEGVQAWVGGLSGAGLSGATVHKVAGVLSAVLGHAVKARRIPVNPARGVALPRPALTRRRYLTACEVERFATAADANGDLVLVLAYCGLRFGELAALRARHVDMLRRRFRVEESVTDVNGHMVWSAPKDHERRSVAFPPFLSKPLSVRLDGLAPDALLFPAPRGEVLRLRNVRRDWWDTACDAAGLGGLTPHELRHTAASLAIASGGSALVVQRMLGHARPSMTLDVYADLFDADLDSVADRLDAARADSLRTAGSGTVVTLREIAL